jgi:aspartate/methionine/tyrosine aminotransferase
MKYVRMPIEVESPEQLGYDTIAYNLAESSYTDAIFDPLDLNLKDLVLCYGDHLGNPNLRAEILRGEANNLGIDDVLVTAGAASALFMVSTALLEKGDRLVVAKPNYATNIETPRAIGAEIVFLPMTFDQGYRVDLDQLRALITPSTRLVSLTCPHNPTGAMISESDLLEVIRMVEASNAYLLLDETYRDMSFRGKLPLAASLSERAISVSSLSKSYGLPGIRIGWIITRNSQLKELFLAAKEQITICGSVVDEEIAYRYLARRSAFFPAIQKDQLEKFHITTAWMESQDVFEWVEPDGGVVCFPRVRPGLAMDIDKFYGRLLSDHKTYVGRGRWFEESDRSFRLGFGWPSQAALHAGLKGLLGAAKSALA